MTASTDWNKCFENQALLLGQPGTTVFAGKILAAVEPDDPESIVRAEEKAACGPDPLGGFFRKFRKLA